MKHFHGMSGTTEHIFVFTKDEFGVEVFLTTMDLGFSN